MKKLTFLILIIFNQLVFSQKEANIWYFGENIGLDFSTSPPEVLLDSKLNTIEGCSTISNKDGELLFYSDGITVWDKNHDIMKYSDGELANNLSGNPSSTQSALVIPNPKKENIYYIFTVGDNSNIAFDFYTVDISKNSNKGEIISGPIDLSNGNINWSEKVTAVQGNDCDIIWVLSIEGNSFRSYKIDENGVDFANPIISKVNYLLFDSRGYLKVSPDGKKIALADYNGGIPEEGRYFRNGDGNAIIFDFNATTGKVSNINNNTLLDLSIDGAPYGLEFSQYSSKLYVSTHDGTKNKVFQFDLTSSNIPQSKYLIHEQVGFRGGLQLAPDSKIYATVPIEYEIGTSFLDVIENPDDDAEDVIYTEDAINLKNRKSNQGLPPFIQSFFSPVKIIDVNNPNIVLSSNKQFVCIGENLTMGPETTNLTNAIYKWTLDENENFLLNTKEITINQKNFVSGTYRLEITYEDICKRLKTFSGSVKIEFVNKPILNPIPIYEQCDFDENPNDFTTSFNLKLKETEIYKGNDNISIDFFEISDTSFLNPLTKENYINTVPTITNTHKLIVKASFKGNVCFETLEIELKAQPTGITQYSNMYTSELDLNNNITNSFKSIGSGTGIFNFNDKTKQIINSSNGSLNLITHNFNYYQNKEDAILQVNELVAPFEKYVFINNSVIYVRISLKPNNSCEIIGSFSLIAQKLPNPNGNNTNTYLCVNNPVDNPQLLTKKLDGSTNNSSDTYKWYLNNNLIQGETNSTINVTKGGTYKVEAYRFYKNNTSSNSDDFSTVGYNTIIVEESNKAKVTSIKVNDDENNPDDNFIKITVSGKGTYEYSLNSNNSSDFKIGEKNLEYTFKNPPTGLNTIFIRDINGCGISETLEISTIYFQRYFTPNGDGINDFWGALGTNNNFYLTANFQIFDRYGRLLKELDLKKEIGWNGFFKGKKMPSNDYWFKATLIDKNGNTRNKKGHFSLIRK